MLDNSQIDLAETNKDKNFEELEQIKRLLNMSFYISWSWRPVAHFRHLP